MEQEDSNAPSNSIPQDVILHKAESPWRPRREQNQTETDEDTKVTADLYKRVRSILNKLTPQKFQTLVKQLSEMEINTEERLEGVTDLIVERAIDIRGPCYCVAYACMCRYLVMIKVASTSKQGEYVNFRSILLTRCQKEFEKGKDCEKEIEERRKVIEETQDLEKREELCKELEISKIKGKNRSLGNIRFIGELFNLKMLTESIMHDCLFKLLGAKDEVSLECVCWLLSTIGNDLDTDEARPRVDQYFNQMDKIVQEKTISSRVRFKLQDVIDLRKCNWIPRGNPQTPKTLYQIHKEVKKEIQKRQIFLHQLKAQHKPKQERGKGAKGSRSQSGSEMGASGGWDVVGNQTTPSQGQSRESSRWRELHRVEIEKSSKTAPPTAKELTDEEMEKKTKTILDEYLHLHDIKEAILCVEELKSPSVMHTFVSSAVNYVLERSHIARNQTGLLLRDLVKKSVLSVPVYIQGLTEVIQYAEKMEITIPKIWQYFGELIGPMIQDGSVPLNFLRKAAEPLKENNKAGLLVAEVLHAASHREGHKKVGSLWRLSSLKWEDFMASGDVKKFIVDKKVEFTVEDDSETSTSTVFVSMEAIQDKLQHLLIKEKADNEVIFGWIDESVDDPNMKSNKFIRALMTSVCESAITGSGSSARVLPEVIKNRGDLLRKYLDHRAESELQALYALQALVHKLEHPQGVLRTLFDTLYDEDIISEDGFNQWEKSKDPNEQEGKGVAMKQVVQFFTWLREAEDDISDS
nr:eukaryotic translation initiation factor 4 gamma 3 isoform X2 [Crassostrea gigas]